MILNHHDFLDTEVKGTHAVTFGNDKLEADGGAARHRNTDVHVL